VSRGLVGDPQGMVDEIGRRLSGGAEVRGGLDESHGEREVEADEGLGVARVWRYYEGKFQEVSEPKPDPHVGVGEVDLGHVDGPMAGIGIDDGM
jgi:hypothetical protein